MPQSKRELWIATSIGFTGTRDGMSPRQLDEVERLVNQTTFREAHHGDCVGADEQFHMLVESKQAEEKIIIVIHPPDNPDQRAFCLGKVLPVKSYLERDKDIAKRSQLMIAAPKTAHEEQRSGTWATVRAARALHRRILIVMPDGKVKEE